MRDGLRSSEHHDNAEHDTLGSNEAIVAAYRHTFDQKATKIFPQKPHSPPNFPTSRPRLSSLSIPLRIRTDSLSQSSACPSPQSLKSSPVAALSDTRFPTIGAFTTTASASGSLRCCSTRHRATRSDASRNRKLSEIFGISVVHNTHDAGSPIVFSPPSSPTSSALSSIPAISRSSSFSSNSISPVLPGEARNSSPIPPPARRRGSSHPSSPGPSTLTVSPGNAWFRRAQSHQPALARLRPPVHRNSGSISSIVSSPLPPLDPVLRAVELASRLNANSACAACGITGTNFPRCPRCGEMWCSRECRLKAASGGRKHVCSGVIGKGKAKESTRD